MQTTRTERPPDEHRRAFTSPADFSLWAVPVGRKAIKGSGGCEMRPCWCSEQRIRDTPRTDNHFIQGHLEPALPVRLPHSPEEEKVNEGTTDLNAANPPPRAAKTP